MTRIEFFVPGLARPGGSKTAFALRRRDGSLVRRPDGSPVINITDAGKNNKEWRNTCAFFARQEYQGELLSGPVEVSMQFVMPRPKGHFGSGKNAKLIKSSAPTRPAGKPDVLKLARAVEDSLSGVLWLDDAQIVDEHLSKHYGGNPGVLVTVTALSETPQADEQQPMLLEVQ